MNSKLEGIKRASMLVVGTVMLAFCLPAFSKATYPTSGKCDGFPKINVATPDGFCLGLIAEGFKFPRGIAPMPNGDVLVVDMGGWVENKGSVWKLIRHGSAYERVRLLNGLDRPNGIALGPDGNVYVGAIGRIFRFDPAHPEGTVTDIVGGASAVEPLPATGRHPLTQLVFDQQGNIFVNVGSETDHCADMKTSAAGVLCTEAEGKNPRGAIRKYSMKWPGGKVTSWETYAQGLRNSMALAIHPVTGEFWQGENSRDAISASDPTLNDAELPHDEINLIKKDGAYGWPYCFDMNRPSPEYPLWDCTKYSGPVILLPAHAAPLGMTFYTGMLFPEKFKGALFVGFHGYRETGHRLVFYPFGKDGKPSGESVDMVYAWGAANGSRKGAPVDVRVGADGAIYMTEDRNGSVVRFTYVGNK